VGALGTFFQVTLRQIRPAAAAGSLLVALYVISDFGSVSILRYETLTVGIYRAFTNNPFDRTAPVVLSGLLVLVTAIVVFAEAGSRGRGRYSRLGGGAARPPPVVRLGVRRTPVLAGMSAVSALAIGVPALSLAYWLAIGRSAALDLPEIFGAATTSMSLAAGGAVVTTALALPVGLLAARHAGWFPRLMERAAYVGHAVPGVVVALSLVFFAVNYAFELYQSVPLVLFAYAVLFLPLAVAGVHASAAQSPPAMEEVARSLGSSPRQVLRRVTLPLAAPGIAAAAVLVFITCIKELTATLMLQPTGMTTLATELWTQTSVRAYAAAAPYAAMLVLLSAVPAYLLGRRSHRWGVRHE
jgi:iron(III) transport system permease protein